MQYVLIPIKSSLKFINVNMGSRSDVKNMSIQKEKIFLSSLDFERFLDYFQINNISMWV